MQSVIQFAGENSETLLSDYQVYLEHEFFPGDVGLSDQRPMNLLIEKGLDGPVALLHIRTHNRVSFSRTADHILAQKRDVYVVAIVRRGMVSFNYTGDRKIHASDGEIVLYDSNQEVLAELGLDQRGFHESFWAVIPSDLCDRFGWRPEYTSQSFASSDGPARLAAGMMMIMAQESSQTSPALSRAISDILLEAVFEAVEERSSPRRQQTNSEKHLLNIEEYVTRNFSSTSISIKSAAAACGISERHVSYILKAAGKSFSGLVWNQRLQKATEWLASPRMANYTIGEIAAMAGYKSIAHFSRSFKEANGCKPKEYRQLTLSNGAPAMSRKLH